MDCPSCGLILTTPNPVPAGTLVNCPKCGTCFGVPALEVKSAAPAAAAVAPPVALAQAVAAPSPPPVAPPAVPAAAPVAPAAPVVARPRAAAPRPAPAPPANDDSIFPELDVAASRRVGAAKSLRRETESKNTERPAKKGKKKNDNAALVWSLVVAGAVVVIGGTVAIAKFAGGSSDARGRTAAPAGREPQRPANAPEKAAAPADKKDKASPDKKKAGAKKDTAAGTAKKKDALADDDSDEPKPIPGLPK